MEGSLQQAKTQLDSCSYFDTIGLPACDGRTDRRTDGQVDGDDSKYRASVASRGRKRRRKRTSLGIYRATFGTRHSKKIWNRASSRDANANRRNAKCAASQVATNRRRRRRRRRRRGSRTALTTSNTMSEPVKPAERDRGQGHGQGHGQGRGQDPVPLKPSDRLAACRSG